MLMTCIFWNCNLQPLGKHLFNISFPLFLYTPARSFLNIFSSWLIDSFFPMFNLAAGPGRPPYIQSGPWIDKRCINQSKLLRSFGHWERMTMDHGRKGKPRLSALLQLNLISSCTEWMWIFKVADHIHANHIH